MGVELNEARPVQLPFVVEELCGRRAAGAELGSAALVGRRGGHDGRLGGFEAPLGCPKLRLGPADFELDHASHVFDLRLGGADLGAQLVAVVDRGQGVVRGPGEARPDLPAGLPVLLGSQFWVGGTWYWLGLA